MLWQWVILGLVIGLLGWTLYRFGLPVIGAVVGGGAGGVLGFVLSALVAASWSLPFFTGAGLIGGAVIGILLMRALQVYFFFITGASLGGALGTHLLRGALAGAVPPGLATYITVAVCAVLGGLLLIRLRRYIIAIVTSVLGALVFSLGFPPQQAMPALVVALVVFLAAQVGLVRRFVEQEVFDERARRARDTPDVDPLD